MSENAVLAADAMGVAALADPQFRLPRLPRLAPGLVVVPGEDGVLVEGGPTRQLLGGRAAADVLGALLPLLDGSRTVEDLAGDTGRPLRSTHSAVALLYASGLLEDADGEPAPADADPAALAFYSRSIDSTRVNASGAETVRRLRSARVLVDAGPTAGSLAESIVEELRRTEIGDVELAMPGAAHAVSDRTLLVLVGDSSELRRRADSAAEAGIGVYPVRLRGRSLYSGPFVDPSYTARFDDLADQIEAEPHDDPRAADHPLAAALVVGDITAILARVGTAPSQQSLVRVDLGTLVQERLVAVSSTPDGIPLAYAFEASTAFAPRSLSSPKDHQVHYKQSNILLQRESKRWPSAVASPLAERTAPPAAPTGALTAGVLSDLVVRTAGNRESGTPREGKVRRWAASGGNLGSVQITVLARRVEGLAPGVYGYQRGDDTWAHLPWADPEESPAGADPAADAVIVLTGALGRVASKYAAFGWRIVHLDAGVGVTHLRLLGAAHGLDVRVAPAWDDDAFGGLLGIDQDLEPITAIVSITGTATATATSTATSLATSTATSTEGIRR